MPPCPNCEAYEGDHLGVHWSRNNSCSAPEPTIYQRWLLTGMLMGDGNIDLGGDSTTPRMGIEMINKKFLEWFDQEMGVFTTGVSLHRTASEAFAHVENGDFDTPTRVENYNDIYRLRSRRIPWLNTLEPWYNSGYKRFPENLTLTPTITKMWYISDGNLKIGEGKSGAARIFSTNENNRKEYIEGLFEEVGFNVNFHSKQLYLPVDETPKFLDWIGDPPPGFEYKWCYDDFDEYRSLKNEAYDQ